MFIEAHDKFLEALCGWNISFAEARDDEPFPNVWIGVSVENQEQADKRIPELLGIPAKVRFLSCEPLLGPVDLTEIQQTVSPGFFGDCLHWYHRGHCHLLDGIDYPTIQWVICGGESGSKARPMHPDWAQSLRDQCAAAGVPFFFKQWGEWVPAGQHSFPAIDLPDDKCEILNCRGECCHESDLCNGEEFVFRVGKKRAGRLLDGVEHSEFPKGGAA